MTSEQINELIAEACGQIVEKDGVLCRLVDIPNYHGDLNACAEMEKVLTDDQHELYRIELFEICGDNSRKIVSATAPQRCEAFLRTIGKWQEQNGK